MRISLMNRLSTVVGTLIKQTFIIAATYTMLYFLTQAVDKLGIALLANLMAKGFPWYGHEFPSAGFELLCEELPFYCSGYVKPYLVINTVGSMIVFTIAYAAYRLKARS
ncbi:MULTISPECIES: hypothetical protein [Bacillales]|uniref:hypothetical protein n=1 Tax=Bacillales TaxID=1385 RepID=UPI0006A794EB|nr:MULTISPECIES: hypothetical protein [Bacillales]OBZ09450.1 hypothetical protein A7975_25490 [Bacillus sp. FJAT-26390]